MVKQYPVRLVGEQHYDDACSACVVGEQVLVAHEIGNPHDEFAIVAKNSRGATIGYIPRDSFVQDVVHEQDRSVTAVITDKFRENGQWQIALAVSVKDKPCPLVAYKAEGNDLRQAHRGQPAHAEGHMQPDDDDSSTSQNSNASAAVLLIFAGLGAITLLMLL